MRPKSVSIVKAICNIRGVAAHCLQSFESNHTLKRKSCLVGFQYRYLIAPAWPPNIAPRLYFISASTGNGLCVPPGKHRGVTLDQREERERISALRSGREHAGMRPTPTRERELTGNKGACLIAI